MSESKRKNHPLSAERSRELARYALDIGDELEVTVTRQRVLETLVECLSDATVYRKVKTMIGLSIISDHE